jgi:hypothetical protein
VHEPVEHDEQHRDGDEAGDRLRGPRGEATLRIAWATNQVATAAAKATPAPATTGRRRARSAPRKLAVTAAKMSTASSPSRKTMIAEFATAVAWPCATSVGSAGPVLAVAMR